MITTSKRSSNKNQKGSDWNPEMNKIKGYNNVTNCNQIWSIDTKTLVTNQGYLYIFAIIDFYSRTIVTSKSFEKLIKRELENLSNNYKWNKTNSIIIHSDNAIEFHCEGMKKMS